MEFITNLLNAYPYSFMCVFAGTLFFYIVYIHPLMKGVKIIENTLKRLRRFYGEK